MRIIQQTLKALWGMDSALTLLAGEHDLNFVSSVVQNRRYLVKVMRHGCTPDFVEMQCMALAHAVTDDKSVPVSVVVPSLAGNSVERVTDDTGQARLVWVLVFIEGCLYSEFNPKDPMLAKTLGRQIARLDTQLQGFTHPLLSRPFRWNLTQSLWIRDHVACVKAPARIALLNEVITQYVAIEHELNRLPFVAIHNDINDNNIVINASTQSDPHIAGLIDFGDLCLAPRICELAIAGAYVVLDHAQASKMLAALVAGYHELSTISERELDLLVPLLRMRLAVSVVTSTLDAQDKPDDPYVVISQAGAWRFLERGFSDAQLKPRLRLACGLSAVPGAEQVMVWLDHTRGDFFPVMGHTLSGAAIKPLSVAASTVPDDPFHLSDAEAAELGVLEDAVTLGAYAEPRLIYTDAAFLSGRFQASARRTVHLGVDVFSTAGSGVYAPAEGVVVVVENRTGHLDYGGLIILEHKVDDNVAFHTLYGHLDPGSIERLVVGQRVRPGECLALLGSQENNGGWSPHLHLQLALSVQMMGTDWPGVADPDDLLLWTALCPNPAPLLNLPDGYVVHSPIDEKTLGTKRQRHFSENLKLSYRQPLMFLRGWKHYLIDQWGRVYLDAYNNVPHVGHSHPDIQSVVCDQLSKLNTNTRYLHPAQLEFAQQLLATLPESLSVCYFVNSGSEANELALRLARSATGAKHIITPDHGYHGNTTGAIDISAYKFNAQGGVGQSDWVHLVDLPDVYRGRYRTEECDTALAYSDQVLEALESIRRQGGKLAGFIAETFPSVGGQIIPPDGYLAMVYQHVRRSGGVCIADEVQTGLGRLGEYFYGFEQQCVIPDIVVLGKPIGNGHPIGAVVTTRKIADQFAQGPEFFSTFGGSTLSCTVGKTVLGIIERENLQINAKHMGRRLVDGLRRLQSRHNAIGDIRGIGLFIGVELVRDHKQRHPASALASHVVNRLRDKRILTGLEGPDNNVLKIRPPLTIQSNDVDMIVQALDEVLGETVSCAG